MKTDNKYNVIGYDRITERQDQIVRDLTMYDACAQVDANAYEDIESIVTDKDGVEEMLRVKQETGKAMSLKDALALNRKELWIDLYYYMNEEYE